MNIGAGFLLGKITILDMLGIRKPPASSIHHLDKVMGWLCRAQDESGTSGVSEGFHLFHGWLPPYPETTGYIIETFFDYAHLTGQEEYFNRAVKMAEWLLSIQHEDGAIPNSYFTQKMVFDTGQVLFGFVRSYVETKDEKYMHAGIRAGEWLIAQQDNDGSWKKHAVDEIAHTYYSRVAWSLLELFKITKNEDFKRAAIKNINWTLTNQRENGWFENASFNLANHHAPFTHTIAYTLRGVWESGLLLNEKKYLDAVMVALNNLENSIQDNGSVPGTLDKNWYGPRSYSCLTGNAQLTLLFLKAYKHTGENKYLKNANKLLQFLKFSQQRRITDPNVYGALAGSHPIWGRYIHFNYPNWAGKFLADALIMDLSFNGENHE